MHSTHDGMIFFIIGIVFFCRFRSVYMNNGHEIDTSLSRIQLFLG
jgi:hypothetical protein